MSGTLSARRTPRSIILLERAANGGPQHVLALPVRGETCRQGVELPHHLALDETIAVASDAELLQRPFGELTKELARLVIEGFK